jgi:hypothetical protein
VTPVAPWHFTTWLDLFDHWQTVIAGVLALVAAFGTVAATMIIANRQIRASREDADRVIDATREQTSVTAEQTATTVRLERMRDEGEALAFRAMLEAAMARVFAEAAWARKAYPHILTQKEDSSVTAFAVRNCITKAAFAELRAACVRQRSPLTFDFLDLEREIDNFASRWEDDQSTYGVPIRKGRHAGLSEQLGSIETKAAALRQKAAEK